MNIVYYISLKIGQSIHFYIVLSLGVDHMFLIFFGLLAQCKISNVIYRETALDNLDLSWAYTSKTDL